MGHGFFGGLLRINLSNGKIDVEHIAESTLQKWMGGGGLAAKILWDEVPENIDPYDPENRLIFSTGAFQGTKIQGAAKYEVVSRSPLTGIYGESAGGARWGIKFKQTGYDVLLLQGRASHPAYIWIQDNGRVEIRDARKIWGKDTYETRDLIIGEIGDRRAGVSCIGPAGENLVRIACIVSDSHSFAGRCGLGAVMGSKNLKAIAVQGNQRVSIASPDRLDDLMNEISKKLKERTPILTKHGTSWGVVPMEEMGDLPIRYWTGDSWADGAKKIGAPRNTDALNGRPHPCLYCQVGCHRRIEFREPRKYAVKGAGPEYQTYGMMGSNLDIDNVYGVAKANDVCNRLGMDTISAGGLIGFAILCFRRGIIETNQTDGVELDWGDPDLLINLIMKISSKQDIGSILSEGIVRAASKFGKEAEEIAMHVKGLDIPAHDARAFLQMAINYATGVRGACHERGCPNEGAFLPEVEVTELHDRFTMENSEFVAARYQDLASVTNSLLLCNVIARRLSVTDMTNCQNAITGWHMTPQELMSVGERIFTLQRMINIKYGVRRDDDKIPKRFFEPARAGPRKGRIPYSFEETLDRYYELRGWDRNGVPISERLENLGIIDEANL